MIFLSSPWLLEAALTSYNANLPSLRKRKKTPKQNKMKVGQSISYLLLLRQAQGEPWIHLATGLTTQRSRRVLEAESCGHTGLESSVVSKTHKRL